jgi:hypothetical protein
MKKLLYVSHVRPLISIRTQMEIAQSRYRGLFFSALFPALNVLRNKWAA